MAITNYYFSENEYLNLLKYILSKNCYFVSNIQRDSPDFIIINSYECLLEYWNWLKHNALPGSPGLYILNDCYVKYPLLQTSIIKGDKKVYFIDERFGGPSIDICYFPLVGSAYLHHYPYYYYEHVEYYKVPISFELIEIFKDISKYIREHSIRIKYYNRIYYCGLEYIKMVHSASIKIEEEFRQVIINHKLL